MAQKPNVLVLGGVGFIGRNFVKYLVDNNVAARIRVADKVLPTTAFLGAAHAAAFANPIVEYVQANLTSAAGIAKVFAIEGGGKFNLVFNLAAETKYGQTEAVYQEKVFDLSVKVATEAARLQVDRFIEVSTAQIYHSDKRPSREDGRADPWTLIAKYKLQAEQALRGIAGLNLIIVRPAIVYGPGDIQGLSPRLICGLVYKQINEKMKFLWTGELRMNTVHVFDVSRALWHVSQNGQLGAVYNLADKNETDQEKFNVIIEHIFGIKTGFAGSVVSNLASLKLKDVAEDVNDKHLKPWSDVCKAADIVNTPLTPYLDPELLSDNHLSIDGAAIEATGFRYEFPNVTQQLIRDQIQYFQEQRLFPPF